MAFTQRTKSTTWIKKEKSTLKKYNKSTLVYGSNYSFLKHYCDIKNSDNFSFKSMYSFLIRFFNDLDKSNKLMPQKEETKEKKTNVYNTASELYNDFLEIFFINTRLFQMLKTESWVINMVLLIFSLNHTIVMSCLKVKNNLIQQTQISDILIYDQCHY